MDRKYEFRNISVPMTTKRLGFLKSHIKKNGLKLGGYIASLIDKDIERLNCETGGSSGSKVSS